MTLQERIQQDIKESMRAQNKQRLATLRLIASAIKQVEVDERITVSDERLLQILDKLAKQRKESITQFQAAKRLDLVEVEEYELALIKTFLPNPLSETELSALIDEAIQAVSASAMSDMGKVMTQLKPQVQGRCDMGELSARIKARLQSA